MPNLASAAALLNIALQDLRAGKADQVQRLPQIAESATDQALRAILFEEAKRLAGQIERIDACIANRDTQDNLWAKGILDDAERDVAQTLPGRLLDIALIGAIRKAKAAEIVSSETALGLAESLEADNMAAVVEANHAEEIATDRRLKARLAALCGADPA